MMNNAIFSLEEIEKIKNSTNEDIKTLFEIVLEG